MVFLRPGAGFERERDGFERFDAPIGWRASDRANRVCARVAVVNSRATPKLTLGVPVLGALLAVGGALLAVRSPLIGLVVLLGIPATALAARRPEALLSIGALLVPASSFHPSLRILSPLGIVTPFVIVAVLTGIVYVAVHPRALRWGVRSPLGTIGLAVIALGSISAVVVGRASGMYWVLNGGVVLLMMSVVLTPRYAESPRSVERWVLLCGLGLAASVLVEALLGNHVAWVPAEQIPRDYLVFRPSGTPGNALLAAGIVVCILALWMNSGWGRGKALLLPVGVLVVAATVALSRTALLAVAVLLLLFVVRQPPSGRSMALSRWFVLLVGIPTAYWLFSRSFVGIEERLGGQSFANASDSGRLRNLDLAWTQFADHPIFGLGLGGFKEFAYGIYGTGAQSNWATADNFYLTILVELGFLGVLGAAFCVVIVARRRRELRCAGTPAGSLIPLAAVGIVSLFFDTMYHSPMLFLFAVSMIVATTSSATSRSDPVATAPIGAAGASVFRDRRHNAA